MKDRYHIIGHGSVPVQSPTCKLQGRVRQVADVLDSRGSMEARVQNAYDTLQVLARQHVRRAEHWRYASSTVFNFGTATAQGRSDSAMVKFLVRHMDMRSEK